MSLASAFQRGDKETVEHLLPRTDDIANIWTWFSSTYHGWLDVIGNLITRYGYNIYHTDSKGHSSLHYAASEGHLEVVKYLICEYHCDPSCVNHIGDTPLHVASSNGHLNIVQYLINEAHCDPSLVNTRGNTPLHYACGYTNCVEINGKVIQFLLSTGRVDPLAKNKGGKTPLYYASRSENSYEILKLFEVFPQCRRNFPVHTYTKLILTGYSGAGKTTISQLILLASRGSSGFWSLLSSGRVTDVEPLTAGIIPLHVESKVKKIGNMVIYDFAGQQEYYSSHSAVLERIMKNSAAIFLCLVDMSQCMEKISESVHYWMSFIENACSTTQGTSHVIIVGSHADLVKSSMALEEKRTLVKSIAESRVKQLTYGGFVSMDCRESKTKDAHHFLSLLCTSQQSIQASQPSISLYCHILYAFLQTKLKKTACTLQELITLASKEEDSSVLVDPSVSLSELLTTLSDIGLIMFIPNQEHPQYSWVVEEKDVLLRGVNGSLFAPSDFKQYRQVASNTGIVPVTTLQELFPQYNIEMLVGCLESMEFCHPVDPSALENIDLESSKKHLSSKFYHLFFPSLIKENQPDQLTTPRFGWCLGCSDPHQFFSNRFLHVLLLRLAFTFPLASDHLLPSSVLHGLERRCQVWRNGISWKSVSGVSTIVEVIDRNRWVIVLMSEKSREAAEIYSSVVKMILHLRQELCRVAHVCECLISHSLLEKYPSFDDLPDSDLFSIRDVARSILCPDKFSCILDRKEGMKEFPREDALLYRESIFAGRNQMEVAELKEEDLPSDIATNTVLPSPHTGDSSDAITPHTPSTPAPVVTVSCTELPVALPSLLPTAAAGVSGDLSRTLGSSDLCVVLAVINQLNKWTELGLQLGLLLPTLERIDLEQRGKISKCKIDMVSAWLQQQDSVSQKGVPSWNVLRAALKKIGENEMADKIK